MKIIAMTAEHLAAVDVLQRGAYADGLVESVESLGSRLRLAPQFAFVAIAGGSPVGYVIAHPWTRDDAPGLGVVLSSLPPGADALHVHDLAMDASHRGQGGANLLFDEVLKAANAASLAQMTLVAVQGAQAFWEGLGFHVARPVQGYDADAVLMTRNR